MRYYRNKKGGPYGSPFLFLIVYNFYPTIELVNFPLQSFLASAMIAFAS